MPEACHKDTDTGREPRGKGGEDRQEVTGGRTHLRLCTALTA